MAKILISGGSGLIGSRLTQLLLNKNHEVVHLSRKENLGAKVKVYHWDVAKGEVDYNAFAGADVVIHLAGAAIADKRWTIDRKREIIESRTKSAALLINGIMQQGIRPKVFIGASAIGYYGALSSNQQQKEEAVAATDFLGESCRLWEEAYALLPDEVVRKVIIRVGVVLAANGGALIKMAGPVKAGIGSALGHGKQMIPWIHIDDICGIFLKAMEDETMKGIYNGVAPAPVTNRELTRSMARVLNKPFFMPALPGFVLKLFFGEMAAMFLEGSAVSAEKIKAAGYKFQYESPEAALKDLLKQ